MKIDKNWSIEQNDTDGVVLIFSEERETTNKEGLKSLKTFKQIYYYPSIYTSLKKYLNVCLEEAKDVEDCVRLIEEVYLRISKLKF